MPPWYVGWTGGVALTEEPLQRQPDMKQDELNFCSRAISCVEMKTAPAEKTHRGAGLPECCRSSGAGSPGPSLFPFPQSLPYGSHISEPCLSEGLAHMWAILGARAPKCVAFHIMVSVSMFSSVGSLIHDSCRLGSTCKSFDFQEAVALTSEIAGTFPSDLQARPSVFYSISGFLKTLVTIHSSYFGTSVGFPRAVGRG